jgi:hypothetical protein
MTYLRGLCFVVGVTLAAAAFAETGAPEAVPAIHWAYAALQQVMDTTGVTPTLPPTWATRSMTRRELADAVKHLCAQVGDRIVAEKNGPWRAAGVPLAQLVREFMSDLEAEARKDGSFDRLNSVSGGFPPEMQPTPPGPHVLLADVVAATGADTPPRPCMQLGFDHWAYDATQRLIDLGLGPPWCWEVDGFHGPPLVTRGLFAEVTLYIFDTGQEKLRSAPGGIGPGPGPQGQAARISFCHLLQEFWPEMRQLRPEAEFRTQVQEILRTYPTLEPVAAAGRN